MTKKQNETTIRIRAMRAGLLAAAMGAALLLGGCGGGNTSTTSTSTWPPATPPATSQSNTYVGTQNPGLWSVSIDHTSNSFSYQNLSTGSQPLSGTFTITNGFLNLGSAGWALEMLSRAVLVIPPTGQAVFAVDSPACQVIPSKTEFEYMAIPNADYGDSEETYIGSGMVDVSSSNNGQDWAFGGEVQYLLPNPSELFPPGISYDPTPDPYSGTCAANSQNSAVVQTTLTSPASLAANFAIGPTGFFMEDRYQSDGLALIGAVAPASPVDLSQLSGATFLGVESAEDDNNPEAPQLVFFSASGTGTQLTGGAFPSNNPAATPATSYSINLGTQDPNNNGYFPAATVTVNGTTYDAYALVSDAGGQMSIFVEVAAPPQIDGFLLFQQ